MVDLPLDVLLLIAEYFKPSEQLTLAAFHRHFLHDFLNRRYHNPVVLTDYLQNDLHQRLDADLSRIRGPLVCQLIKRLELRTQQLPGEQQSPLLFSRLQRLVSWSPIPFSFASFGTTFLNTLEGLPNLRSLHLTEIHLPGEETFVAFRSTTTWIRLLRDAWPVLAPKLEEFHVQGYVPLLQAVANLNPQACLKLSTLCITSGRVLGSRHDPIVANAATAIVRFIIALSPQLVCLGILGNKESAMSRILEELQKRRFPCLRAFHVDLIHVNDIHTYSSSAKFLLSQGDCLSSLSIRPQMDFVSQSVLSDFFERDCGVLTGLRRLDLDLASMHGRYDVGSGLHADYQRRFLDFIQQLRGLEHLELRQPVMWSVDLCSSTGAVMSGFNPRSTFGNTPRTFKALRTLSLCVKHLRAQIFQDMMEAAPRLEEVELKFQEVWYPIQGRGSRTEHDIVFEYGALYLPAGTVTVFVEELSTLRYLQDMQLHHLQLIWKTDRNLASVKHTILAALRKSIPSLRSLSGVVEFIQSPKMWQEQLRWIDRR